jgi:hypothetical protein|tara:strand:+ start:256 stop:636 length:381 start_codon:yes stop_codon:yes gene_type:complete
MEYEFINDAITGIARANFSLDHEIMGPWLEVEVGHCPDKLTALLTAIHDVDMGSQHEILISGAEFSAEISKDDVVILNNASLNGDSTEISDELTEQFDNFDQYNESGCGLDDFKTLLMSWSQFIRH